MRWNPKPQPAPRRVSLGSASKPSVPAWRPTPTAARKVIAPKPKPYHA